MSDYLYAIIPYKSDISINSQEENPFVENPIIQELKGIKSELTESDGLYLYEDFLMINTCYRQSAFVDSPDGYSWLRVEIYKIAKALGAKEVWYADELATDEMRLWDFSFNDWIRSFHEGKRYASELTVDILKGKYICTYYHDSFSDILIEKPQQINKEDIIDEDDNDDDDDEYDNEFTLFISLQNDGNIQIELKDYYWHDIATVSARSLKEANEEILRILSERQTGNSSACKLLYKNDSIQNILMPQYLKALDLASWKHRDQKDKAGKPYFGHIARVSNACKMPQAKIVALLHDVIEDTDVTPEQLEEMGFSEFIIKAVLCLTHQEGESYENYVMRAAKNSIARQVKISDLEDNMDIRRLEELKEEDFYRLKKYLKSWRYLNSYEN